MGPSSGYLGSLSQDPLGRIFSKCAFLNLLSPLVLPLPSKVLGSSKKLKIFPRGCEMNSDYLYLSTDMTSLTRWSQMPQKIAWFGFMASDFLSLSSSF